MQPQEKVKPQRQNHLIGEVDVVTQRMIVGFLGVIVLGITVALTVLSLQGHEVPPSLPALGGMGLGALTTMLNQVHRMQR